ncbi:type 1 fimbrial protein [Salmonella enterica subsp. enterica serovar Oranienburg]|nr:type 1 fimbrial protein [Salmonella enterica subsp. enterica serovar Pomona]ECS5238032.1 type 1 fimbrial protein [Salmonella enterica subsp. enterica serovar Sundsvall]ECU7751702.1 type 1 fimbrial protein [Salmonella enterica]EDV3389914.1 type 1 fimbrial protein [Salmonella enterica subsp. enterica serovar Oranienburg]EDP9340295.1 type 1 fimbrial protein [Salmonella enterica subsp. enterica serovar Sundsvall]
MKIKNRLFLLGAAMAVMSSSAFADTTGTQTFTAKVTADTCTIANLQQVVDLGNVLKADFKKNVAGSTFYFALGHGVDTTFEVTGCPTTITTVEATPTFTGHDTYVENTGTSTTSNIHLGRTKDGAQLPSTEFWTVGVKRNFMVNNKTGSVSIPVQGVLSSLSNTPMEGSLQFNVTFAFDFV